MATQKEQWQKEFDEDVRQFDTNTAITKEQMATQKEQWKAEYDLDVKNAERDYDLALKQIDEDIRHNKVSESQGQQQIDLAKEELDQKKSESAAELAYKYTALDKEYGSSSSSSGSSSSKSSSSGTTSSSSSSSKGNSSSSGNKNNTKPTYNSIKSDLNTYIANGASKSEINNYLREALNDGYITQTQYNELKETFAPRGQTYR
jgi:hypothetical protein